MAFSMRTIFVAVRAANYTDRATREVGRNIEILIKEQQRLRQHAVVMASAGVMWLSMAGLITTGISQIVSASAEGRRAFASLGRATNEMLKSLGESFTKVMAPAISMLTSFFRAVAQNQGLSTLIAVLGSLGVTMLVVKGISMFFGAALDLLAAKSIALSAAGHAAAAGGINALYTGLLRIQAALGPIILGFSIGASLASLFGKNAGTMSAVLAILTVAFAALAAQIWSGATALSILTFGLAAAVGMAAMAASQVKTPSYDTGVEYARRTTMAVVHEGEKIIPARERGNVNTGGMASSGAPYPIRNYTFNFNGPVQTQATKEELKPLVMKWVRDAVDNKA